MNSTALYLLSLSLRPCADEAADYVRVTQRAIYEVGHADLPGNYVFYHEIRQLAEIAPDAIKVDPSVTGVDTSVYLTRPEVNLAAWSPIFPGLDLEDLMCAAIDAGYVLGLPLGSLEKHTAGLRRQTPKVNGFDAWASSQRRTAVSA